VRQFRSVYCVSFVKVMTSPSRLRVGGCSCPSRCSAATGANALGQRREAPRSPATSDDCGFWRWKALDRNFHALAAWFVDRLTDVFLALWQHSLFYAPVADLGSAQRCWGVRQSGSIAPPLRPSEIPLSTTVPQRGTTMATIRKRRDKVRGPGRRAASGRLERDAARCRASLARQDGDV
jgi:hypothetical protein